MFYIKFPTLTFRPKLNGTIDQEHNYRQGGGQWGYVQ